MKPTFGHRLIGIVAGALALLAAFAVSPADAQGGQGGGAPVFQNWYMVGTPATLAVSSVSGQTTLATGGFTARVCNIGSADAYVVLGTTAGVTATTGSGSLVQQGRCQPFNLMPFSVRYTHLAAITAASTTTLRIESGLGAPTAYDGNSSSGGGSGTPGGSSGQGQYNAGGGNFGGITGFTTDGTSGIFASGNLKLSGSGSGTSLINAPATGGGTATLFPGSDTIAGIAATQIFTNKTFDTAGAGNVFKINGTTISAVSGTGAVCLASGSACGGAGAVSSVFGRTGAVVAAANDYNFNQLAGTAATSQGGLGADESAATGLPLFSAGTVTMTATSGSGNIARVTSPTFVTPALGTPTSGDASNLTNIPVANATGTLAVAHGGTANTTALTNGQLWIGNTGNPPSIATLTAGTNITITNAAGSITIAATGGGSGCSTSGSNTQALTDNGAGGCSTDANATFVAGALSLGSSGTVGTVTLGNATSGTVKIQTVAGALSAAVASMPAGTYTVVGDSLTQTLTNKTMTSPTLTSPTVTGAFTATGLVTNADLANSTISGIALGSNLAALTATDGSLTFSGSYTGATARTVGLNVGNANTWTAVQTITNDDLRLLGSGTGYIQFHSANSGSSNFTVTVPAVTDVLALAGTGAVISSNGTTTSPSAATFNNNFPLYTVNATTAEFDYPVAANIQASGGGMIVSNPSANSYTIKPNGTDNLNGANASITVPAHDFVIGTGDGTSDFANILLGANLTSAHLFVGAASGYAADVAMSGDATMANTGAITVTKSNGSAFGTAAFVNTGTSGGTALVANGTNTLSGVNTFTAAAPQIVLGVNTTTLGSIKMFGNTSGDLTIHPAAVAGTASVITFPAGTTDFSATGGTSRFLKQASAGAALTVVQPASTDLSDTANISLLNAAEVFTGQKTFAAVLGGEDDQSGTTYTLVASDCGKTVAFSNGSAVTVTIAASIVPSAGTFCDIKIRQDGAGQVSVNGSAVTAATLVSAHSYTKTAAQHAIIGLELTTISATATAVLTGDGA